jgi:hypothetical protein
VSDTTSASGPALKLIGRVAALDLVLGGVLAIVGVSQEVQLLAIIGVVLMVSGGAMLAVVTWQRNKPTAL